ncbi:MAG: hypothetical protein ABIQ65_15765 [Thermoanaerobaculia bacterium]
MGAYRYQCEADDCKRVHWPRNGGNPTGSRDLDGDDPGDGSRYHPECWTDEGAFHEWVSRLAQTDPEAALAEEDARYHDHLPEGVNCRLCGIEHAALHPEFA